MTLLPEELPDGRRGRLLALGLAAVALAVLWLTIITPLLDWYSARAERLSERRVLLANISALAGTLPALRRAAHERRTDGPDRAALLDGESDAIASATLQGMLQQMAGAVSVTLRSAEMLPAEQHGQYRRVGVRLSLNADWPVVVDLLQSIKSSHVQLLVDDLQLHAVAQADRSSAAADPQIDTQLTVLGFRAGHETGTSSASVHKHGKAASPPDIELTGHASAAAGSQ
jgi:general secretion pathway protein M